MIRCARLALSLLSFMVLVAVPMRVAACSCVHQSLAEAVRGADFAFVGTLVATNQPIPAPMQPGAGEIVWSWQVERARDAIDTNRIDLAAWPDDGANCGVSFSVGERWLIIAHRAEGHLSTSGCAMNQRMDGVEPDVATDIELMLSVVPAAEPADPNAQPFLPSMPVVFMVGAIALLAAVSGWAFLRRRG